MAMHGSNGSLIDFMDDGSMGNKKRRREDESNVIPIDDTAILGNSSGQLPDFGMLDGVRWESTPIDPNSLAGVPDWPNNANWEDDMFDEEDGSGSGEQDTSPRGGDTGGASSDDGEIEPMIEEPVQIKQQVAPANAMSQSPPSAPTPSIPSSVSSGNSSPQVQPMITSSTSRMLTAPSNFVTEMKHVKDQIDIEMNKVRTEIQKVTSLPMPASIAETLVNFLGDLARTIGDQVNKIQAVERSCLFSCTQLHFATWVTCEFQRQLQQLNLYKQEIQYMATNSDYGDKLSASLFITQHPFPSSIKQHIKSGSIEVRLLTAARTQIAVLGPVRGDVLNDWNPGQNRKETASPVKGGEENLTGGAAHFNKLYFTLGTGVKPVQMKFSMAAQSVSPQGARGAKQMVESPPSEPFIVITNTKQWAEAQGVLLKRDVFRGRAEATASLFCNVVQLHFLLSTRQTMNTAARPLSPSDFEFFFKTKFRKPFIPETTITQAEFDNWWIWFGPTLQKIRYYKFLLPMWTQGLFWGFIGKPDAEKVLSPFGAGSFILRFSEREAGGMTVAYKQAQNIVRHYLMKGKDINIKDKNLPQFIRDTHSLLQFLKVSVADDLSRKLTVVEKEAALGKIGPKRPKTSGEEKNEDAYYDENMQELAMDQLRINQESQVGAAGGDRSGSSANRHYRARVKPTN